MWRQTWTSAMPTFSHAAAFPSTSVTCSTSHCVAARVGGLGHAGPGREDVVAAGGNVAGELLPRLAQLALEAIADDGVADRLRHGEAEPRLAGRVVLTRKPVQRQVAGRDRPALPVDRVEVLRP